MSTIVFLAILNLYMTFIYTLGKLTPQSNLAPLFSGLSLPNRQTNNKVHPHPIAMIALTLGDDNLMILKESFIKYNSQ